MSNDVVTNLQRERSSRVVEDSLNGVELKGVEAELHDGVELLYLAFEFVGFAWFLHKNFITVNFFGGHRGATAPLGGCREGEATPCRG